MSSSTFVWPIVIFAHGLFDTSVALSSCSDGLAIDAEDTTSCAVSTAAVSLLQQNHQERRESGAPLRHQHAKPSEDITAARLNDLERHFAGLLVVAETKVRLESGGDRMNPLSHNYGPTYAQYLNMLVARVPRPTLVEVGILSGTGLAMWQALFPQSPIYGFDIDPSVYRSNRLHLQSLGFSSENVTVHDMDQTKDNNTKLVSLAMGSKRANIVVDDGYHYPDAARKTFDSILSSLDDNFVYFYEDIEDDNWTPAEVEAFKAHVARACPACTVDDRGRLGIKQEGMIVISHGL